MARNILFLILTGFLILSCAEILPLSGGETDQTAPKPVPNSQIPEQGEIKYSGSTIEVTFDEYIVLNDPSTTATINPAAGKVTVTNNKKKVTIGWSEPLQPNTTYIVQLNGTIQDLNEKNDTIHQFVFSTGATIDSLSIKGSVRNAFSAAPSENYSVGLFALESNPLQDPAIYMARTDRKGEFSLEYLKDTTFQIFAYLDANKDRKYTTGEAYAYLNDPIQTRDTTPLKLASFTERNALNKLQINLQFPGTAVVFGRQVNADSLQINGQKATVLQEYRKDSLLVTLPPFTGTSLSFTYQKDTVSKLILEKDRKIPLLINCTNYKKATVANDTLVFTVSDLINQIDTSKILITDSKSTPVGFKAFSTKNKLYILPQSLATDKYNVTLLPKAIQGPYSSHDTTRFAMENKQPADLSIVNINCKALPGEHWLIQLMDGKTVVASQRKTASDSIVRFENCIPGTYQIRCIQDLNENGFWDAGNFALREQPELLYRFEMVNKLRPNWEIEETLEIKSNE